MIQRTFDSLEIGDKESLIRTVSERDVLDFAALSGDINPLHVDKDFAATTSYKDRVVHGMFGASLISNVIGMKLPGSGALWMSQNLEFVSPIRIGDTLRIDVVVLKKHIQDNSIEVQMLPLPMILEIADAHLSPASGSTAEALSLGVPCLFFDTKSQAYEQIKYAYEDELESQTTNFWDGEINYLRDWITSASNYKPTVSDEYVDVMDFILSLINMRSF